MPSTCPLYSSWFKKCCSWQIKRLSNNPMVNVRTFRVEIPHNVTKPKHTHAHRLRTFSLHSQGRWSTGRSRWSYPSRESSRCSGGLPDLKVTKGKSKGGRKRRRRSFLSQSANSRHDASPSPMVFLPLPSSKFIPPRLGDFWLASMPYCR